MNIRTNIPLKNHTTMRLGGSARFMADFHSVDEVCQLAERAKQHNLAIFILGGGSNTIARDAGFDGIVARNRIMGYEILHQDPATVRIKVGSGENWDETVKKTVTAGWSGIEALSAIPGTVGAAPVQNIGAYGQEVSDAITELEAVDLTTGQLATLQNDACNFSYRSSIFRTTHAGRYCIVSVTLELSTTQPSPPFYAAVQQYFDEHSITQFTPQIVRDAVIAIRSDKLPDPTQHPNAGSFFKNAVIEDWLYRDLLERHPDMPAYDMADKQHKIPSGWLIETLGYKGQLLNGIRVHSKNALVLINESATSYDDLSATRETIKDAVRDEFRIELEQEPLEL